jgi:hypothetical protein
MVVQAHGDAGGQIDEEEPDRQNDTVRVSMRAGGSSSFQVASATWMALTLSPFVRG